MNKTPVNSKRWNRLAILLSIIIPTLVVACPGFELRLGRHYVQGTVPPGAYLDIVDPEMDGHAERIVFYFNRNMDTVSFNPVHDLELFRCPTSSPGPDIELLCLTDEEPLLLTDYLPYVRCIPTDPVVRQGFCFPCPDEPGYDCQFMGVRNYPELYIMSEDDTSLTLPSGVTVADLSYVWDWTQKDGNTITHYDRLTIRLNNHALDSAGGPYIYRVNLKRRLEGMSEYTGVNAKDGGTVIPATASKSISFAVFPHQTAAADHPFLMEATPAYGSGISTGQPFPPHENLEVKVSEALRSSVAWTSYAPDLPLDFPGTFIYEVMEENTRSRVWMDTGFPINTEVTITLHADDDDWWRMLDLEPGETTPSPAARPLGDNETLLNIPPTQDHTGTRLAAGTAAGPPVETPANSGLYMETFTTPAEPDPEPQSFTIYFKTAPIRIDEVYEGQAVVNTTACPSYAAEVGADVDRVQVSLLKETAGEYQSASNFTQSCTSVTGGAVSCHLGLTSLPDPAANYILRYTAFNGTTNLGFDQIRVQFDLTGDSDGDALPDGWELQYSHDVCVNEADLDGGGEFDALEIKYGRDPLDPSDDAHLRVLGEVVPLSSDPGGWNQRWPNLAYTGSYLGVAYTDYQFDYLGQHDGDVVFQLASPEDGRTLAPLKHVSIKYYTGWSDQYPSIIWEEEQEQFLLLYQTDNYLSTGPWLKGASLNETGVLIQGPIHVYEGESSIEVNPSDLASLASYGSTVVFGDETSALGGGNNLDVRFIENLTINGERDINLSSSLGSGRNHSKEPTLAENGAGIGAVFKLGPGLNNPIYNLYFSFITDEGDIQKKGYLTHYSDININPGEPHLIWSGEDFVLAWEDQREDRRNIYVVKVDHTTAEKLADELRITFHPGVDAYQPKLAAGLHDFAIVWRENDGTNDLYITQLADMGASLVPVSTPLRICGDAPGLDCVDPDLIRVGGKYALVWSDNRTGNYDVYLAFIGLDADDDGLTDDEEICFDGNCATFNASEDLNPNSNDTDGDGISDEWEADYYAPPTCDVNPLVADSHLDLDTDGLSNQEEYQAGTDPCDADPDGDGLSDREEITLGDDGYITDPFNPDSDDDKLLDGEEFSYGTDPSNRDTDYGGVWDGEEVHNFTPATDPTKGADDKNVIYIGEGTDSWRQPLRTEKFESRTQSIYLESEIKRHGKITSLALDLTQAPPINMNAFNIRLLHTNLPEYAADAEFENQSPDFIEVYGMNPEDLRGASAGWHEFVFTKPFDYSGNDNLIMDVSFDNSAKASTNGMCRYSEPGSHRTIYYSTTTNDLYGEPSSWPRWDGPLPYIHDPEASPRTFVPNLRLTFAIPDADADGLPDWFEYKYQSCGFDPVSGVADVLYNSSQGEFRVSDGPNTSEYSSIAWTGSEYGVCWSDNRDGDNEIYFTRVSSHGAKIGADVRLTDNTGFSGYPSLAWTGTEFGVSWQDNREGNAEIYFGRVGPDGDKIGSDYRVTTKDNKDSQYPSLAWTGSEFGVSWHDFSTTYVDPEIVFIRISATGTNIGGNRTVSSNDSFDSKYPSLSWTGLEFGVSWQDFRNGAPEIYFRRVAKNGGSTPGPELRVTTDSNTSSYPKLAWAGSEFGVAWQDARNGNDEVYFARISAASAKIGTDFRVTNDDYESMYPSLAWTGSEFGLTWDDDRDGNNEIHFTRVSPVGSVVGADIRITNNAGSSEHPSLSWTGSEFGMSWQDSRSGNSEIYFNGINKYSDKDNDILPEDDELALLSNPCDPDTDGDGMPDGWEVVNGADPNVDDSLADPDDDGLTNFEEFTYGTDPQASDTDGDGMGDGWEVDYGFDPLAGGTVESNADPDQDGLINLMESKADTDPNNPDCDSDHLPDGLEVCLDFDCETFNPYIPPDGTGEDTDPLNPDTDGDLINDGDELGYMQGSTLIEGSQTNPADPDTDDDGPGDNAEILAGNDPRHNDAPSFYEIDPPIAQVGWTVYVHGKRFGLDPATNCSVYVGGVPASIQAASDPYTLIFTVPPGTEMTPAWDPGLVDFRIERVLNGLTYHSRPDAVFIITDPAKRELASREPLMASINAGDTPYTVYGRIDGEWDQDNFRLRLPAGRLVTVQAAAIDPQTGATVSGGGALDLKLSLISAGWVAFAENDNASPTETNPAPLTAIIEHGGTYYVKVEAKPGDQGFYRAAVQIVTAPYLESISPAIGAADQTITISGVNFNPLANNVTFEHGNTIIDATALIESQDENTITLNVPDELGGETLPYQVVVFNPGTGQSSLDPKVALHNQDMTFYYYSGPTANLVLDYAGSVYPKLDLDDHPAGLGHTGPGRGDFFFYATGGQGLTITAQLTDNYGNNIGGIPDFHLYGPGGGEITTADRTAANGLLTATFIGAEALPATGYYVLQIITGTGTPPAYFRVDLAKEDVINLKGADGLRILSGDNRVIRSGQSLTFRVQVTSGVADLHEPEVPVEFKDGSSAMALTDGAGTAQWTFTPAAAGPGSKTARLGGTTSPAVQFNFYVLPASAIPGDDDRDGRNISDDPPDQDDQDPDQDDDGLSDGIDDNITNPVSFPVLPGDWDGDGTLDISDTDNDNNTRPDTDEGEAELLDTDGDGIPDYRDPDNDNDGVSDLTEIQNGDSANAPDVENLFLFALPNNRQVGESVFITVIATNRHDQLVANAPLALVITAPSLATFSDETTVINLVTGQDGETVAEIILGNTINTVNCPECKTTTKRRFDSDTYHSTAGVNTLTASATSPDGQPVTADVDALAFPGPADKVEIWAADWINNSFSYVGLNYGMFDDNWNATVIWCQVTDDFGNVVSNETLSVQSSHQTIYKSGPTGGPPILNDDLAEFVSLRDMTSDTYGAIRFNWLMDHVPGDNVLTVTAKDDPDLTDTVTVHGTSLTGLFDPVHPVRAEFSFYAHFDWRGRDPESNVWRAFPSPFLVRAIEPCPDVEPLQACAAGENVSVKFITDSQSRVTADPELVPTASDGYSLKMDVDDFGMAAAYLAPGFYEASAQANLTAVVYYGDTPQESQLFFPIDADTVPIVRAEVRSEEGVRRELAEGGLALTAEHELLVTVKNNLGWDIMVRVDEEPLGNGAGAVGQMGDVIDWEKVDAEEGDRAHFLYVPSHLSEKFFALPLNPDSDGADLTLSALYNQGTITPNYELATGVSSLKDGNTLEAPLKFRVAAVRLESISLSRWHDIELYNGMGGTMVTQPEWVREERDVPPSPNVLYHDSITAPTAVVKDENLLMAYTYTCLGLDSFDLTGLCQTNGSADPDVCPYGDIGPETGLECGGLNRVASIISSTKSPSSVMASLNIFKWKVNIHLENTTVFANTLPPIEETHHRIYTLFDDPKAPWSIAPKNWIETMEMATHELNGFEGSCSMARSQMVRNVYNNHLQSIESDNFYFIRINHPFKYDADNFWTKEVSTADLLNSFFLQWSVSLPYSLRLHALVSDIHKIKTGNNVTVLDCFSNAMLSSIMMSNLGCSGNRFYYMGYDPDIQTTRMVLPQGGSPQHAIWDSHFYQYASSEEYPLLIELYYDSTLKLSYNNEEKPECYDGDTFNKFDTSCYFYADGIDSYSYDEHFFQDGTARRWFAYTIKVIE